MTKKYARPAWDARIKLLTDEAGKPTGEVQFYASVFNNVDLVGDRVLPGAFAKSLENWREKGDPIPVIFSHTWGDVFSIIGYANAADVVEDETGLLVKAFLDVAENPTAAQVWRLMDRRIVKEASFAYDVVREKKSADGANELLELDLIEVGPTLKGANPATGDFPSVAKNLLIDETLKELQTALKHVVELKDSKDTAEVAGIQSAHDMMVALGAACSHSTDEEKQMADEVIEEKTAEEVEAVEEKTAEEPEELEIEESTLDVDAEEKADEAPLDETVIDDVEDVEVEAEVEVTEDDSASDEAEETEEVEIKSDEPMAKDDEDTSERLQRLAKAELLETELFLEF